MVFQVNLNRKNNYNFGLVLMGTCWGFCPGAESVVGMREMGSFVQNSGPECSLLQNNFPTLQGWGMGIYIYIYI